MQHKPAFVVVDTYNHNGYAVIVNGDTVAIILHQLGDDYEMSSIQFELFKGPIEKFMVEIVMPCNHMCFGRRMSKDDPDFATVMVLYARFKEWYAEPLPMSFPTITHVGSGPSAHFYMSQHVVVTHDSIRLNIPVETSEMRYSENEYIEYIDCIMDMEALAIR
jgi:hypothetical protein